MFNAEVTGILKELHENQNKMSDRLEKLSSRVDTIYNYPNEEYQYEGSYDYETEQYEDIDLENIDPSGNESFESASEVSEPPKKMQKLDKNSIFKNISEKLTLRRLWIPISMMNLPLQRQL